MLQAKVDRLATKIDFFNKKETQKTPKIVDNFLEMLTLESVGRQTDDTK